MKKIRAYTDGSAGHFDWLEAQGIQYKDSVYDRRAIFVETDDCLLYTGSESTIPTRLMQDLHPADMTISTLVMAVAPLL